jgi:hypothetical protein
MWHDWLLEELLPRIGGSSFFNTVDGKS